MDAVLVIPENPVEDKSQPAMGSEYSCARRYIARFDAKRARESDADSHGANQSDFGAGRLDAD